ncbi:hypothetical protein FHG87_003999 [Trinorchestia longiramus]|nr:hypothetical protein FHG87_003999 [Trinorchestia longiramus]
MFFIEKGSHLSKQPQHKMRLSYRLESDHKLESPSVVVWTESTDEFPVTVLDRISSEDVRISFKKMKVQLLLLVCLVTMSVVGVAGSKLGRRSLKSDRGRSLSDDDSGELTGREDGGNFIDYCSENSCYKCLMFSGCSSASDCSIGDSCFKRMCCKSVGGICGTHYDCLFMF